MKIFRLCALTLLLVGVWLIPERPASACEADPGQNCPAQQPRPNGCKCCSDNHCASGRCNINTDKCEAKPDDELPPPEEPPDS